MRHLSANPTMRTASNNLSTPTASASAVNSGTSKDTFTWLWAARLYISSGLISLIIRMRELLSVISPQWSSIRRFFFMSLTHSSRYRCSIRPVLNELLRRRTPCTSYPFSIRNSARKLPSCPVIPVINATFPISKSFSECKDSEKYPTMGRKD